MVDDIVGGRGIFMVDDIVCRRGILMVVYIIGRGGILMVVDIVGRGRILMVDIVDVIVIITIKRERRGVVQWNRDSGRGRKLMQSW